MDVDIQPPKNPKKSKNFRKNRYIAPLESTNKFKHWEIRAALVGFACNYVPAAKSDIETMGIENWFKACIDLGKTMIPYTEPELKEK